jgi:biotin carboxyl carrier protein
VKIPMNKQYKVTVNGKIFDVNVEELGESQIVQNIPDPQEVVAEQPKIQEVKQEVEPKPVSGNVTQITSPMPGNIWKIIKKPNDKVNKHETILILEVMKMENEIVAPEAGIITNILVNEGNKVDAGQVIIEMTV